MKIDGEKFDKIKIFREEFSKNHGFSCKASFMEGNQYQPKSFWEKKETKDKGQKDRRGDNQNNT